MRRIHRAWEVFTKTPISSQIDLSLAGRISNAGLWTKQDYRRKSFGEALLHCLSLLPVIPTTLTANREVEQKPGQN